MRSGDHWGIRRANKKSATGSFLLQPRRDTHLLSVTKVWEILRAFASFGFCKAHAAAFALPTYQSAWLKTHYPAEFIAGVLTHDPGMYPKRLILDEARQMGIVLAPLDVNKSDSTYRVEEREGGQAIRIALSTISGISDQEVKSIVSGRPYVDIADFIARSGASTPVTESLILTGGFDELHSIGTGIGTGAINHRDLLLHLNDIEKSHSARERQERYRRRADDIWFYTTCTDLKRAA